MHANLANSREFPEVCRSLASIYQKGSKAEKVRKTSKALLSPFWPSNRIDISDSQIQEAGIDLAFLNARYYDGNRGQFLSQDPSFLDIGNAGFEGKYERTLEQHLMNPQALNSYSYGLNNPITNKDPEGEVVPLLAAIGYIFAAYNVLDFGVDAYSASIVFGEHSDQFTQQDKNMAVTELTLDGLGALGGAGLADEAAELTLNGASAALDIADLLGNGKYKEAIDRSLRTDSSNSDKNPHSKTQGQQQTQNKPDAQTSAPTNNLKPVGWEGSKSQTSRASDYVKGVFNIK